jgi:hypothetical protein
MCYQDKKNNNSTNDLQQTLTKFYETQQQQPGVIAIVLQVSLKYYNKNTQFWCMNIYF